MNKTDDPAQVGKHRFELAGLGKAPFRFAGMSENLLRHADGHCQPGGSCDYCGNGIRFECWVLSADGRRFKVGSDCIRKVDDSGLMAAYKSSPQFREHQRKLRLAKAQRELAELDAMIAAHRDALAALPHPHGFLDRKTGAPLTRLDSVLWLRQNAGATGRAGLLRSLKTLFPTP